MADTARQFEPPGPKIEADVADPWGLNAPLQATLPKDAPTKERLALAAARCFQGIEGRMLLAHLRHLTVARALGPGADDCVLRHLEGQRQLVAHLLQLIAVGRRGPPTADDSDN